MTPAVVLKFVVGLACLGFAVYAWVRRRNPGEAAAFLGLALIAGAEPVIDGRLGRGLGLFGIALVLIGLVLILAQQAGSRPE